MKELLHGMQTEKEIRDYLGKVYYFALSQQLKKKGMMPSDMTETELYAWKLNYDAAKAEMLSMKELYQEKSGDYSY
jgi:hypothetical protein